MSASPGKTLECPACGMRITGTEDICPTCGRALMQELKFECPHCGELIPRSSKTCPFCLMDPGSPKAPEVEPAEEKLDDLLESLIVEEAGRVKDEGKGFSCPECAWLLDGTELKCPKCGIEFTEKVKVACPICAASVDKTLKTCPICGSNLHPSGAAPAAQPEPQPLPVPGANLPHRPTDEAKVARPEILKQVQPFPRPEPRPAVPSNPEPPSQPREGPPSEEPTEEDRELESAEEALGVLSEIATSESSPKSKLRKLKGEGKVTNAGSIRARSAEQGLSNGVGQVNGSGSTRGAGRTNGSGRVNGRINGTQGRVNGKVNGTGQTNGRGAVNGRSLVNGTGVSNGLKGRHKGATLGRASTLFRWQFLAILVAVMIAIPAFLYFSTSDHQLYEVDGKFGDWEDAPMFGARIQSSSPSTDIQKWAVAADGNDLYLYLGTRAALMGTNIVESVYMFIDRDGLNSTGYLVGTMGADYLMQISGWNGSVQSSDLLGRLQGSDRYNWSAWTSAGGLTAMLGANGIEAMAVMPSALAQGAQFLLVTKDSMDRGSTSHQAPLKGGTLIVSQEVPTDIAEDGIVPMAYSTTLLRLRFTCEGEGGTVQSVTPSIVGASPSSLTGFALEPGQEHVVDIVADLSGADPGQLVSAVIERSGITSTFSDVEIDGQGSKAYVYSAPAEIVIDGAFGDWVGKRVLDQDSTPITDPCIDINETGNVSTSSTSYFYVSVKGEIWNGSFVPSFSSKPSGSGSGGAVVPARRTGEDVLSIYIDSDKSTSTGQQLVCDAKIIGADHKIELKGIGGKITSSKEYDFSSGTWATAAVTVGAAKDETSVEVSIAASALGGSSDIDFIVQTTSWKSMGDLATYTPGSQRGVASIQTWPVTGALTSPYATSMSYQRKIFYDGTNLWSFYFDGSNTVCRYSTDLGATWTLRGNVFVTTGVNETSLWYDSSNNVVYAVGDTSTGSVNVYLQKGSVNPSSHNINFAASDSTLASSTNALGGKNTFICRDVNGYIWVLSSNYSSTQPKKYELTAFRSTAANSIATFAFSGQMLSASGSVDTVKGSIVPAGTGSDMWSVYTSSGPVYARKYTGAWGGQTAIATGGATTGANELSPPTVVVDAKGVVHVVWGTTKSGQSPPTIKYSHNDTGATTFTAATDLDPWIASDVGDYYPTLSLDTSTGDLYSMWLRTDTGGIGRTVMVRKCVSGIWSNVTLDPQTSYPKQYLTSVYSISGQYMICWQWTQNTTGTIQVIFDRVVVPEFSELALPVTFTLMLMAAYRTRSRKRIDEARRP